MDILKNYVINIIAEIKSIVDYETEKLIMELTDNLLIDSCNKKRRIIINKLEEYEKEKINEINNNFFIPFQLFYQDFQLFILSSEDHKICNETSFNIIKKHIHSKELIVYVKNIDIDELSLSEYLHLKDNLQYVNIKSIRPMFIKNLNLIPNNIKGLSLYSHELENVPEIHDLNYLDISYNNLTTITVTKNLIYLDVRNNKNLKELKKVSDEEYLLQYVDITNTKLSIEHLLPFKHLNTIKCNCNISDSSIFQNFKSLHTLHVNKLDNVPDSLLELNVQYLPSTNVELKTLYSCSNNIEIGKINGSKIEHLKLENNLFSEVHNIDQIKEFKNLISLSLIYIPFSFYAFENLKELTIKNYNMIITKDSFIGLPSLKKLYILNPTINDNAFDSLTNLEDLTLLHIKNEYLQSMPYLPLLEKIYLSFDSIIKIQDDFFSRLVNIKDIGLENLEKDACSHNLFNNLHFLRSLKLIIDLTENEYVFDFKGLDKLTSLTLRLDNHLAMINIRLSSDLSKLKSFELICIGGIVPNDIFSKFPNLRDLKCWGIKNINKVDFSMFALLETLDIRGLYPFVYYLNPILKNNKNLLSFKPICFMKFVDPHEYCNK